MLSILRFGVCRSSDSSIQAARLIAACDLAPYCQRIASAFSPGHDSPSNDRFSPHAGIPPHGKQYFRITATFGILPRACNLKCADCRSCDGFLPCPGFTPDSLVQRTSIRVREVFGGLTVSPACLACLGRACATKAMLFSCLQDLSLTDALRSFYISAHKKTSPVLLSRRQKKS